MFFVQVLIISGQSAFAIGEKDNAEKIKTAEPSDCTEPVSHKSVLERTVGKLLSINTIEYKHLFCLKQSMYDNANADTAMVILDFTDKNNIMGARYLIHNRQFMAGYDGSKYFSKMPCQDKVSYVDNPSRDMMTKNIFMMNSVYVLRMLLPEMIKDTSVIFNESNDTITNGINCFRYNILLKDKSINPDLFISETKGVNTNYELYISKETFLPVKFLMLFEGGIWEAAYEDLKIDKADNNKVFNTDYIETTFNVKDKITPDKKNDGDLSDKNDVGAALNNELKTGDDAPDWNLSGLDGKNVNLSSLKGKTVVLEFWFPGCAGCVSSIPFYNDFYKKYSNEICFYALEFTNAKPASVNDYVNEMNIKYPVLHTAATVSKAYCIRSAPTVVVIDKLGKIKYFSTGSDKSKLIEAINK